MIAWLVSDMVEVGINPVWVRQIDALRSFMRLLRLYSKDHDELRSP